MKVLGIAPPHKNELPTYIDWVTHAGYDHKLLEQPDDLIGCDALLLCGGADIGKDINRDDKEYRWLEEAYLMQMPIIGICRGLQIAVTDLRGELIEDIKETSIQHVVDKTLVENSSLKTSQMESSFHDIEFIDGVRMNVNSRHHQAADKVPSELEITAISKDGIIEVLTGTGYPILLVQWHPERIEVRNKPASDYVIESMNRLIKQ